MATKKKQKAVEPTAKRYTLAPLKWSRDYDDVRQKYRAEVPFGTLYVERCRKDWDPDSPWEPWTWGYCFDEYHDEDYSECKSLSRGKQLAQEEWERRLVECLIECE